VCIEFCKSLSDEGGHGRLVMFNVTDSLREYRHDQG